MKLADAIYRISTPYRDVPGGFSFNQYLLKSDQPLLFRTGPRKIRALVQDAISRVIAVNDLQFIALSHYEGDGGGLLRALAQSLDG